MEKYVVGVLILAIALSSIACGQTAGNNSLPAYETVANDALGCNEIVYHGVIYRPFGVCNKSLLEDKIGVTQGESDIFIYSIKGYDSSQWICDMVESGLMDSPMLYKATGVTDIPYALEEYRAYDW